MALELNPGHTALLAMDFENDIVHEEGAFKDFGFAQMVKDNDVLGKTASLLTGARSAGVLVIYVSVKFRPGYPERPANGGLWQGLHGANALIEGTWGASIHDAVAPQEGEPVVTKRGVSAFMASDLEPILKNKPRRYAAAGRRRHQLRGRRHRPRSQRPGLQRRHSRRLLRLGEPGSPRRLPHRRPALPLHHLQQRGSDRRAGVASLNGQETARRSMRRAVFLPAKIGNIMQEM